MSDNVMVQKHRKKGRVYRAKWQRPRPPGKYVKWTRYRYASTTVTTPSRSANYCIASKLSGNDGQSF
jgi:hypothetical protein